MDKCLQNTVYRPMKIRTVFSKTDWLGVKNTAVTCGTYQFNNGKKKQLWGIILYIRLIQKIEIFLKNGKSSSSACSWNASLKTPQDRFLEIKPSRLLSVSNLSRILSTIKWSCAVKPVMWEASRATCASEKVRRLCERSTYFEYHNLSLK